MEAESHRESDISEAVTSHESMTKVKRISGKKLRKIKNQMEFYFSDANLEKDRILGKLVLEDPEGFVDLKVFQTFNRIRSITDNIADIVNAVSRSDMLEVNHNMTRVHRKNPFVPQKKNRTELTIYVEKLPPYASHRFVKNIFQQFGNVTYISLPHFRNSTKNKGFAFVEFDSPESVKRACEGLKLPNEDEIEEPLKIQDEKIEIQAEEEKRKRKADDCSSLKSKDLSPQKNSRKRKKSESSEKISKIAVEDTDYKEDLSKLQKQDLPVGKNVKKRKRQSSESDSSTLKKHKVAETAATEEGESLLNTDMCSSVCPEVDKTIRNVDIENNEQCGQIENVDIKDEAVCHEGQKRKRKKIPDDEKLRLKVMSMIEWKNYRNKYLTMQRKAMSAVKRMLLIDQRQRTECDSMLCHASAFKEEQNQGNMKGYSGKGKNYNDNFQEGVIVKVMTKNINLPLPFELRKQVKLSVNDVAYVDTTTLDNSEVFVRFNSPNSALLAAKSDAMKQFGVCEVISGQEESLYWEKLEMDRNKHKTRQRPKKRGRDKVLEKSAKLVRQNTHIFFD